MPRDKGKEEEDPYLPSSSAISNGTRGCGSPMAVNGVHRDALDSVPVVAVAAEVGVVADLVAVVVATEV